MERTSRFAVLACIEGEVEALTAVLLEEDVTDEATVVRREQLERLLGRWAARVRPGG